MKEIGMTDEKAKQRKHGENLRINFCFSFMLAFIMPTFVIHQFEL